MPPSLPHRSRREMPSLPIKAWYLGYNSFDSPYRLAWTQTGEIFIYSGDEIDTSDHSEHLYLSMSQTKPDIIRQLVQYVNPDERRGCGDKVMTIRTYNVVPTPRQGTEKALGYQYSQYFKQGGDRGIGDIVIKFDSGSPAWMDATYTEFIKILKCVDSRHVLNAKSGAGQWEVASRMATLFTTRLERESAGNLFGTTTKTTKPASRSTHTDNDRKPKHSPLDDLDDWSPPPPSTRAPKTRRPATRSTHTDNGRKKNLLLDDLDDWSPPPPSTGAPKTRRPATRSTHTDNGRKKNLLLDDLDDWSPPPPSALIGTLPPMPSNSASAKHTHNSLPIDISSPSRTYTNLHTRQPTHHTEHTSRKRQTQDTSSEMPSAKKQRTQTVEDKEDIQTEPIAESPPVKKIMQDKGVQVESRLELKPVILHLDDGRAVICMLRTS
ncbi:hypothetical protein R3P38DRAFT_2870333 [Favolaschia claudopus]|uniref:Uncharacterized protein n=1 Tax=Favolaschia claudopus TaxID=2862362 RepID=A0AAW0DC76_9AGAR